MIIRNYESRDWEEICQIFSRAKYDEMRGSCDLEAVRPMDEDEFFIDSFNKSRMVVAEVAGKVVGYAGYEGSLISWLMVNPAYYRQGIGKRLLEAIIPDIGDSAYLNVARNNTAAVKLYTGMGFQLVTEYRGLYNGYEAEAMLLALKPELQAWARNTPNHNSR